MEQGALFLQYSHDRRHDKILSNAETMIIRKHFDINNKEDFSIKDLLDKNLESLYPDCSFIKCVEVREDIKNQVRDIINEGYKAIYNYCMDIISCVYLLMDYIQEYFKNNPNTITLCTKKYDVLNPVMPENKVSDFIRWLPEKDLISNFIKHTLDLSDMKIEEHEDMPDWSGEYFRIVATKKMEV